MDFKELNQQALAIRKKYDQIEQDRYGRSWTREELMLGFIKDIGDLALLIQSKEGVRRVEDVDNKLEHELSDCLWSIMVLAEAYGIDLEAAFLQTMKDLDRKLEE